MKLEFYDEGQALLKLGKPNEAIGLFDKALAINPNSTEAFNDKEKALNALGREK
jgi:tetratricopeptide (TPR) repeat protein